MKLLSRVRLFVTPWTVAHQAPLSVGFSRQEYWSGLPFPSPGDLPNPGIEPRSPALQADALTSEPPGKPSHHYLHYLHHSLTSGQKTGGIQSRLLTENWIKGLLSMAPHIRIRPSFPFSQSLPSGSFHKPFSLLYHREDRLKTTIMEN